MFLIPSSDAGLLSDTDDVSLAGDGTPVKTAAFNRSKKVCNCRENGVSQCSCNRHFSQPDCNSGWDSYRECFFSGYHLYRFTASTSFHDFPVFVRLHPASRHDSVSLVITFDEFRKRYPFLNVDKILLDAAHDAMPIYKYFDTFSVNTFIDLNKRNTGNIIYTDTITLSPDGIPICKKGLQMKDCGLDNSRRRRKFRCPSVKNNVCICDTPCSDSSYGRCVYIYTKDNLRLFPSVPRNSEDWNTIYKRRTSVECSNKREEVDYKLEAAKHRSTKMWYIRIYGIMMCQHLDAWFSEFEVNFKDAFYAC